MRLSPAEEKGRTGLTDTIRATWARVYMASMEMPTGVRLLSFPRALASIPNLQGLSPHLREPKTQTKYQLPP